MVVSTIILVLITLGGFFLMSRLLGSVKGKVTNPVQHGVKGIYFVFHGMA
jgi:hypothetical protein